MFNQDDLYAALIVIVGVLSIGFLFNKLIDHLFEKQEKETGYF